MQLNLPAQLWLGPKVSRISCSLEIGSVFSMTWIIQMFLVSDNLDRTFVSPRCLILGQLGSAEVVIKTLSCNSAVVHSSRVAAEKINCAAHLLWHHASTGWLSIWRSDPIPACIWPVLTRGWEVHFLKSEPSWSLCTIIVLFINLFNLHLFNQISQVQRRWPLTLRV